MALLQKLQFVHKQYKDPRVFIFTKSLLIDSLYGTLMMMARERGSSERFLQYLLSSDPVPFRVKPLPEETTRDLLMRALTRHADREIERLVEATETPADMPGVALSITDKRRYRGFLDTHEWAAPLIPWLAKEINKWVKEAMPDSPVLGIAAERRHPLRRIENLRLIADWVRGARPNIMSYSLEQAAVAEDAWHKEEAEKERLKAAKAAKESYGDPVFSYGGYNFYDLKTKDQLKAEGCIQGICVGRSDQNYWKRVESGRTKIYSMRQGERGVATVEVTVNHPADFYASGTVVQVRGRFNQKVTDPAEIKALEKFMRKMRYESIVEPWDFRLKFADKPSAPGLSGFVRVFGRGR